MKTIDRLAQFIDFKGISHNQFDKIVGKESFINSYIRKKRSIGSDNLEHIFSKFPELSAEWLLKNEGEMLLEKSPSGYLVNEQVGGYGQCVFCKEKERLISSLEENISMKDTLLRDKDKVIGLLEDQIDSLKKGKGQRNAS